MMLILSFFLWLVAAVVLVQQSCLAADPPTSESTSEKLDSSPSNVVLRRRLPGTLPRPVSRTPSSSNQGIQGNDEDNKEARELRRRKCTSTGALLQAAANEATHGGVSGPEERVYASLLRKTARAKWTISKPAGSCEQLEGNAASECKSASLHRGAAVQPAQERQSAGRQLEKLLCYPFNSCDRPKYTHPRGSSVMSRVQLVGTRTVLAVVREGGCPPPESTAMRHRFASASEGYLGKDSGYTASPPSRRISQEPGLSNADISTSGEGGASSAQERQALPQDATVSESPSRAPLENGAKKHLPRTPMSTALSPEQTLHTIMQVARKCRGVVCPRTQLPAPGILTQALMHILNQMFQYLNSAAKFFRQTRSHDNRFVQNDQIVHRAAAMYQKALPILDTGVPDDEPASVGAFLVSMTNILKMISGHPLTPHAPFVQKGIEAVDRCAAEGLLGELPNTMACLLQLALSIAESQSLFERVESPASTVHHLDLRRFQSTASRAADKGRHPCSAAARILGRKNKGEKSDQDGQS